MNITGKVLLFGFFCLFSFGQGHARNVNSNNEKIFTEFKAEKLSKKQLASMLEKSVHSNEAPVVFDRLRVLSVLYVNFDGKIQQGEMVVLDVVAEEVLEIFKELFRRRFPIHKVRLMDEYGGDDDLSMDDNNSSCYNYRVQVGSTNVTSAHGYGVAIDINPIQNPYFSFDEELGTARCLPKKGIIYANRMKNRIGKSYRQGLAEEVVDVFAQHGFYTWGGHWDNPIDYQHFQISKSLRELLLVMDFGAGVDIFNCFKKFFNKNGKPLEGVLKEQCFKLFNKDLDLLQYYKEDAASFYEALKICMNK